MVSVIIPAHNEEATIERCLSGLVGHVHIPDLQLIVVCNGCTDRTVEVAKTFGDAIDLIQTPVASKTHALNLGDRLARNYPRVYMDADVMMTLQDLLALVTALEEGALAASPQISMNLSQCSWAVRAYYAVWTSLPYARKGLMGSGVYGLSRVGRDRFMNFPDIIADDGFVRLLFSPHERSVARNARSIVSGPRTVGDLIKIKTRSRLGGHQLTRRYPHFKNNEDKTYWRAGFGLLCCPRLWSSIPVYLYVNLVARRRAHKQFRELGSYIWERDEGSRIGAGAEYRSDKA